MEFIIHVTPFHLTLYGLLYVNNTDLYVVFNKANIYEF
jgi:hypothetical protein